LMLLIQFKSYDVKKVIFVVIDHHVIVMMPCKNSQIALKLSSNP